MTRGVLRELGNGRLVWQPTTAGEGHKALKLRLARIERILARPRPVSRAMSARRESGSELLIHS